MIDLTGDGYLNPQPPENRPVSNISSIIIHHDAVVRPHDYDSVARYRTEAAAHYERLGPGLQYHFKIDNVGQIFKIRNYDATLWHASNLAVNRSSLAICLDGYFHPDVNQQPTREQVEALQQLLDDLCFNHPEFPATQQNVFGHREVALPGMGTACPGEYMIHRVESYRASKVVPLDGTEYDWPEFQPSAPTPPTPVEQPTVPSVEVNYRVFKGGKQIGAYKTDTNAWNKYKAENADNIMTSSGQDVTAQFKAKFEPVSVPPAIPTPPAQNEEHNQKEILAILGEQNTVLARILEIVQTIMSFLTNIFKWRKK